VTATTQVKILTQPILKETVALPATTYALIIESNLLVLHIN
jgi:hypothetical protein